jgi:hypothetical protein
MYLCIQFKLMRMRACVRAWVTSCSACDPLAGSLAVAADHTDSSDVVSIPQFECATRHCSQQHHFVCTALAMCDSRPPRARQFKWYRSPGPSPCSIVHHWLQVLNGRRFVNAMQRERAQRKSGAANSSFSDVVSKSVEFLNTNRRGFQASSATPSWIAELSRTSLRGHLRSRHSSTQAPRRRGRKSQVPPPTRVLEDNLPNQTLFVRRPGPRE